MHSSVAAAAPATLFSGNPSHVHNHCTSISSQHNATTPCYCRGYAPLPQTFAQPVEAAPAAEPLTPQQARKEYKPLTPEDLAQHPIDPEQYKLPAGYHWYETMIVLRAMMDDQGR